MFGRKSKKDKILGHSPYPAREERVNRQVKNYFILEVASVPPDFDIHRFLSLRESVGVFEGRGVNLKQVELLLESIKHSPVFAVMNNPLISMSSCIFVLQLLNELGLTMKTIPNPIKSTNYKRFLSWFDPKNNKSGIWMDSQEAETINFIIVNMYQMMGEDVVKEVTESANTIQQRQEELEKKIKDMKLE